MIEKLDELRRKRGLSQKQVAELAGLPPSRISRWKEQAPAQRVLPALQILRLARLFQVPLEYLLDDAIERPEDALPRGQQLTDDEQKLLETARVIGPDIALRRVVGAPGAWKAIEEAPSDGARAAEAPSSRNGAREGRQS